MLTRYWDRRRFIRVPASGPVRWRSGGQQGHCELLDLSPGGVGLRLSARSASRLGPTVTLEVELAPGVTWRMAEDARVARQCSDEDGTARVGLELN